MSLVTGTISNVYNGVSQQAPQSRHQSQSEALSNYLSSIAEGLRKRNPRKHLAKLTSTVPGDAFLHSINRDTSQRFSVVITSGGLAVYDKTTGAAQTVSFPSGTAYLTSATPSQDFAAVTVADTTFIVNKTIITAMTVATSAATLTGTKQRFTDLPAAAVLNEVYKVEGDTTNSFTSYYVKGTGGTWQECIAPSMKTTIDAATMPWKLVRTGLGTFTFDKITWNDRLVGDNTTNKIPSFIGLPIADVFFLRNRLGLLADENTVMSRSGDYFNFFSKSVTAALDTDPIDTSSSHTKVSLLRYAVPFNKTLMLFADQTQFQLTGGDVLTPKTVSVDPSTAFESSLKCRPSSAGTSLFFALDRGTSSSIREYYVNTNSISNDAADITAHVPSYLPPNIFRVPASSNEDVTIVLSSDKRQSLYVYKYYWGDGEKKVQSAWQRFDFDAQDSILDADFIGSVLYLIIQCADGLHLETIDMMANVVDADIGFNCLLDRRKVLTGTYNSGGDYTEFALPYSVGSSALTDYQVCLGGTFGTSAGNALATMSFTPSGGANSPTLLRVSGNYSTGPCYVGRKYESRWRLSPQFYRDAKSNAILDGVLKLKKLTISFKDTGSFRAEVTPLGRDKNTYQFTGRNLGVSTIGARLLSTGTFSFPVGTDAKSVVIEIVNDSHLPCSFQSFAWTGEFTLKARPV